MNRNLLDFEKPIAELEAKIDELRRVEAEPGLDIEEEVARLERKSRELTRSRRSRSSRHGRSAQLGATSGAPLLPWTIIERVFTDFEELHGDRSYADDPAVVGGLCRLEGSGSGRDRPPEGPQHQGKGRSPLWDARPGGVSKGAAPHAARRPLRAPRADVHRHSRGPIPEWARRSAARARPSRETCSRWPRCPLPSSAP